MHQTLLPNLERLGGYYCLVAQVTTKCGVPNNIASQIVVPEFFERNGSFLIQQFIIQQSSQSATLHHLVYGQCRQMQQNLQCKLIK